MALSDDAEKLWQTATALALKAATVSPHRRALPPLMFFTDPDRTPAPWQTAANLPAGSCVVFRAFSAPDAIYQGRKIKAACAANGVLFFVGRDAELAKALGADGIHLPERDLTKASALREQTPQWLITGAVHSASAWERADDLDAAIVSPVFRAGGSSASKPELGLHAFEAMCAMAPCPVYGLGGINASNVETLLQTRACGLAGVDAIQNAFRG